MGVASLLSLSTLNSNDFLVTGIILVVVESEELSEKKRVIIIPFEKTVIEEEEEEESQLCTSVLYIFFSFDVISLICKNPEKFSRFFILLSILGLLPFLLFFVGTPCVCVDVSTKAISDGGW